MPTYQDFDGIYVESPNNGGVVLRNGKPPASGRSLTRAEASRINGAKSRGPVTSAGKSRSSRNSVKHGLTARDPIFGPAAQQEYMRFKESMLAALNPLDEMQSALAENIVRRSWVLRMTSNAEASLICHNFERATMIHHAFTSGYGLEMFTLLSRYRAENERSLQISLATLHRLQDRAGRRGPSCLA